MPVGGIWAKAERKKRETLINHCPCSIKLNMDNVFFKRNQFSCWKTVIIEKKTIKKQKKNKIKSIWHQFIWRTYKHCRRILQYDAFAEGFFFSHFFMLALISNDEIPFNFSARVSINNLFSSV